MNFEIFLFLLFMSFVSFAVGVIVWVAIVRFFGRGSQKARILSESGGIWWDSFPLR